MSYHGIDLSLRAGELVILDGGTGTELERRGATMSPEAWCGAATIDNQDLLKQIHLDYIAAGARVITANTYASSRLMLEPAGFGEQFDVLNRTAVNIALEAREASGVDAIAVAGSLSHMVPMQPGGTQSDRSRNPSTAQLTDGFGELAALHKDAGCDVIILEMMFHPERMPLALAAAVATGLPVWAGMSVRRGPDGQILSFTTEADIAVADLVSIVRDFPVEVAGIMHSPSDTIAESITAVQEQFAGPTMAYPDSGYFAMPDWQFEDIIAPSDLHTFAEGWKQQGVQVLGGCCGLSPQHIEALAPLGPT